MDSRITISIMVAQWANITFTRPYIDPVSFPTCFTKHYGRIIPYFYIQEWLGLCCRWIYDTSHRTQGLEGLNYRQFLKSIIYQILGSNLSDSTIRGTGFGREILPTVGNLQGPPLLVQVVGMTEITQLRKPKVIKFRLSDGEREVEAVARVPLNCNFDFGTFDLGYKVS